MVKRPIFPAGSRAAAEKIQVSPGLICGDYIFLTGITGSQSDGAMPTNPETQIHAAFGKIGKVLEEAGLSYDAIVEMTSYHVGLRSHFDLFNAIRCSYVEEPYPAWTAVEVAGLRREGAIVEIRVIAHTG